MGCYEASLGTYRRFGIFIPGNVGNYRSTLRDVADVRRPHLHRGESLKLRKSPGTFLDFKAGFVHMFSVANITSKNINSITVRAAL